MREDWEVIWALQSIRSPWLDSLFLGVNALDSAYFWIAVLPAVWFFAKKSRFGKEFYYLMLFSTLVNELLKSCFQQLRPCEIDPSIALVCTNSFGMPSGGAQNAMVLGLLIWTLCHKIYWRIAGLLFIALMSFSRVYLGMHFPSQVVVGWIVGSAVFFTYRYTIPKLWRVWDRRGFSWHLLLLLFPPCIALLLGKPLLATLSIGVAIGTLFDCPVLAGRRAGWIGYGVSLLGLLPLGILYAFLKKTPWVFFLGWLMGMWFTFFAPRIQRVLCR